MAISSRGEMGVGGGSRGGFGGGGRSVKPSLKKKLAEPKSAVKVVKGSDGMGNIVKNEGQSIVTDLRKSGDWAKITAPKPGKPNTTVKINSGKTAKKAAPAKKAPSYWELKGLPSLVKINSGTGNKTVSPITYRAKATKKAAPAKRATGRKSN
jgi:hypothetical protein